MAARSELLDYLIDHLAPLGHVAGRAMFGGHGLYLDGTIIGILVEEVAYLKADDGNRADFEAAGMRPFTYDGKGKPVTMPYWEIPPEVLEDPEALRDWAMRAHAAAMRAQRAKTPGARTGRSRRRPPAVP